MFFIIIEKIFFLIVLISSGIFARKLKLLSKEGEKDLSKLLVDFFWPAAIFGSITSHLHRADVISNALLPLLAFVTAGTGLVIALGVARLFRFKNEEKQIFLYHGAVNNFVFMVLPFAQLFLSSRGEGLLFLHNLGYLLFIWTIGVSLFQKQRSFKEFVKRVLSPGLIATIAGLFFVLFDFHDTIPQVIYDLATSLGKPTVIIAMLIAGSQIYDLGITALKWNNWNIALGFIRLILIPAMLLGLAIFLKPLVSSEVLVIFMLVNTMPVSVNSISLARRFGSSPELAAEGVVFTHLFGIITMPVFIYLTQIIFVES